MTLLAELPRLTEALPLLLEAEFGQLLPGPAHPELARLDLADEGGLTSKGRRVLRHLRDLAGVLDLPLA